jgi:hypothetical protein
MGKKQNGHGFALGRLVKEKGRGQGVSVASNTLRVSIQGTGALREGTV